MCSVVWWGPQHLCGGGVVAGTHCPGQAECDAACTALLAAVTLAACMPLPS